MNPILYSANTTNFNNNGIGPLTDCISCNCTQSEGTFELEIEYPTSGVHFKDINYNCWLKVVIPPYYEESPQLFYIVKITRPINKRVTIIAYHMSYRLSYLPISPYGAEKNIKNLFNGAKVEATDTVNWRVLFNENKLGVQHKTNVEGEVPSLVFSGKSGLYLEEGQYVISYSVNPSGNVIKLYIDGEYVQDLVDGSTFGVLDHEDGSHAIAKLTFPNPTSGIVIYDKIQVEAGTQKTDYEPFKSQYTALLSTVLSGIPSHSILPYDNFPFSFDTDIPTNVMEFKMEQPCSAMDILGGNEGSVLAKVGGYFKWDNNHVHHLTSFPDHGYTLRYGVNITSLSQEENISETVTGIVPYWYDSNYEKNEDDEDSPKNRLLILPENRGILYCENHQSFSFEKIATVDFSSEFDDNPGYDRLREAGLFWMKQNKAGIPDVSLDVDFVELSKTNEYEALGLSENVDLYDQVTVIFPELNVDTKAIVTETTYNVLRERYENIKIGERKKSEISSKNTVSASIGELRNVALAAVAHSSAVISGGRGGYIVTHMNEATGEPDELYVMDKADPEDARQLIRINKNGIGFSTNGGRTYKSAWTIDGVFNADFIQTGTINADYIKAGTLDAQTLRNNGGDVDHLNASNASTGTLPNARLGGETRSDITVVNWNGKLLHYYLDHGITKEDSYWLEDDSGWEAVYSERH